MSLTIWSTAPKKILMSNQLLIRRVGTEVIKVDKSDLEKIVHQSESKPKPKKGRKPKNIDPPTNSRPKRVRRSPNRLNISTTRGRSYAHVVAGL